MLPADWGTGYANVWLGTTAEDADAYQQRVSHLLTLPAAIPFVSYEPALGPLGPISISGRVPDWIIIGGETALGRTSWRGTHPRWARDAIAECRRENVAPFLKQWGTYTNNPLVVEEGRTVEYAMQKDPPENGKGGGKLDGKLCREFPPAQKLSVLMKGRIVKDACAGRALLAG